MNKYLICMFFCILTKFCCVDAAEFTVSSYNCGGLSEHYDYLRAAAMQKLMQERYNTEPAAMAQVEKIQQVALRMIFSKDPAEQELARHSWNERYQSLYQHLISSPAQKTSPNHSWSEKCEEMISSYRVRPVVIQDSEVRTMLVDHLKDLTKDPNLDFKELVAEGRRVMAERIFRHHLKYDIICLQEATYLDQSMFPKNYSVSFARTDHSVNGVAWNNDRFELVEEVGDILGKAYAVKLLDKESGKTVLIASGHITGCNPFEVVENPVTNQKDSDKGDNELKTVFQLFETIPADIKLIGMDSNVTASHPRMYILQEFDYQLDSENYLEQTCTNPNMVVNTRIDWIAVKSANATITNIPVLGVGLNSMQTNMSDHKPIAARIVY